MPRLSVALICIALGATIASPAAAQWKWKSKDGRVQYSDLPPPAGVADQDILQRPSSARRLAAAPAAAPASAAASAAPQASARVEPELEAKRKKAEQDEAARKKVDEDKLAAQRADNCTRAKSELRSLDDGLRIARTNEKGEREILDDKQRADETRRVREVMASDCK